MTHWKTEPPLDKLKAGDIVDDHCADCGQKTGQHKVTQKYIDWMKSPKVQEAMKKGTLYGLLPTVPYKKIKEARK
jgi:hypothetical protein